MSSKFHTIFLILLLMLASCLLSLAIGSTSIPFTQLLFAENERLFLTLRLIRTFNAFLCGGLLALAGSLMQLLLQNPLADPYILGISGGAAFFTLLAMTLSLGEAWLIGGAWIGSLLTMLVIFLFSAKHRWQQHTLLLLGIALASIFSAGISFLLFLSPSTNVHTMLFWLSGDLNGSAFSWPALIILSIGFFICLLLAPGLNILSLGDKPAFSLGLHLTKYRIFIYLLSSIFTATAVSIAGCIAFVGLIIPHIVRQIIGNDHKFTLPCSVMLGGMLVMLADTAARTVFSPAQFPVGIMMVIIGAPLFIWLLQK